MRGLTRGFVEMCARCCHLKGDLELGDRAYVRPACGWIADRDHNAAPNVLARSWRGRPQCPWGSAIYRSRREPPGGGGAMSRETPRPRPRGSSLSRFPEIASEVDDLKVDHSGTLSVTSLPFSTRTKRNRLSWNIRTSSFSLSSTSRRTCPLTPSYFAMV